MATSVVVMSPNAKRQSIKITPNTSILQILEQACSKQNLNPLDYDLVHLRKTLDLSMSVRFANLPNNALLEITPSQKDRVESKVTICLQTETVGRMLHDFSPTSTLWDVLNHWIQLSGENVLRGDIGPEAEPVFLYMRKEVVGEKSLRDITLRNLGLTSGKALIRLLYRVPETLKTQAYVESILLKPQTEEKPSEPVNIAWNELGQGKVISGDQDVNKPLPQVNQVLPQVVQSQEDVEMADVGQESSNENVNVSNTSSLDNLPSTMERNEDLKDAKIEFDDEADDIDIEDEDCEIRYVGNRDSVLYDAKQTASRATENFPDDFFELTVEDARYLFATLQKERKDLEEQPFCLGSSKKDQKMEKMLRFKTTILRIQFPDRLVLQASFSTLEKVSSVMDFVRQFLIDKNMDFHLFTTPPKTVLDPNQALYEAELVPASLLYVSCNEMNVLKPEVAQNLSSHRAACLAADLIRNASKDSISKPSPALRVTPVTSGTFGELSRIEEPGPPGSSVPKVFPSSRKVPNWFKKGFK